MAFPSRTRRRFVRRLARSIFPVGSVEPAGIVDHFLGALAGVGDLAAADQGDVGGEFQGFRELVRGHDDGAPGVVRVGEQALQHRDGAVVERGEGLVEQQHFGIVQEGAGHGETLAHAAGKFANQAVADAIEAGALQPFRRASCAGCRGRRAARRASDSRCGKLVVKRDAVAQDSDAAAGRFLADVRAEDRERCLARLSTDPAMIRRSVVLPAPLRPRSATVEPASTRARYRAGPGSRRNISRRRRLQSALTPRPSGRASCRPSRGFRRPGPAPNRDASKSRTALLRPAARRCLPRRSTGVGAPRRDAGALDLDVR